MPKLPNPSLINRSTPTPAGPAGTLSPVFLGTPGADTAIGDALLGIGDEAFKFAMVEKERMDNVAIDDAKNQYLQKALELENEFSQIRGKNAVDQDIVKDYRTKLDALSETITPTFKNDAQRRMWDSYYGKSKVQFTAGVMKHKLRESDRYASETHAATISTNIQVAHSNPYDTRVANASARAIVESIAKEKVRAGWGKDRTETELRNALGPLWSGIAAKLINDGYHDAAKEILEKHEDVIGLDKYSKYNEAITQQKEQLQIKEDVGVLFAGTPDPSNKEISDFFNERYSGNEDLIKQAITTAKATRTAVKQDQERVVGEENNRLAGAMITGQLDYNMIGGANLDNKAKLVWKEKLDKKMVDGPKYKSDVITRADLMRRANTDPENLSDDDIWNAVYQKKGITDIEAQGIQAKRDAKIKALTDTPGENAKTANVKRAHKTFDDVFKNRLLDEDPQTDAILKARAHEDLDDFMLANPDANPLDYVEQQLTIPESEQNNILMDLVKGYGKVLTWPYRATWGRLFDGEDETTPEGKAAAEEFTKSLEDPLRQEAARILRQNKMPVNADTVDRFIKNNEKLLKGRVKND